MATAAFKHTRLDCTNPRAFRTFELLPSPRPHHDGVVRCELRHCTLDQDIRFEAMSYAWGAPDPKSHILINGPNVLGVTRNCYEALLHLRHRSRRRTLWVDAICIDQHANDESTRERNHQVMFMSEIFTKAEKVIVWLGCSVPGTTRMVLRWKALQRVIKARDQLARLPPYVLPWHGNGDIRGSSVVKDKVDFSPSKGLRQFALNGLDRLFWYGMSECIHTSGFSISLS